MWIIKRVSPDRIENERIVGLSDDSSGSEAAGGRFSGNRISSIGWVAKKNQAIERLEGCRGARKGDLTVSILHRSGRHRDFANAFLIRQATPAHAGFRG